MSLKYRFLDEGRGLYWTASGAVSGADWIAEITALRLRVDRTIPVLYVFIDYGAISEWKISAQEIRQLGEMRSSSYERRLAGRVTVTYAPSDLSFGIARMWETIAERPEWETAAFRERPLAIAWLRQRVAERFGFLISLT